ncbi:elastase-1-like [Centruroides vittatus]|uniref:elastase-1-like n=1 Tax=Centruroides vittatus TaxID=120091 RepID=UPI0035103E84
MRSTIVLFILFQQIFNYSKACDPSKPLDITVSKKGDIFSPGYEKNEKYPLNTRCMYFLHTEPGKRIRLKFVDFDVESTESCGGDSLRVFEGHDMEHGAHGIFCGDANPEDILSIENELFIAFYSDFMINKRGFHFTYEPTEDESLCPNDLECTNRRCVSYSKECDGVDDCGDATDEEECEHSIVEAETCGEPTIKPTEHDYSRIVGGFEATPGSWPWQADIQFDLIHPSGHTCGGSLINSQWIVTASHCFEQQPHPRAWRIHLGNHHKFSKDNSEQIRYPEHIIIYPDIPEEELKNWQLNIYEDLTLVKLNAPIKFTNKVQPVCLPDNDIVIPIGTECYATGWGLTKGTGSNDALKQTKLIIHGHEDCESPLVEFNHTTMICAGMAKGLHGPCHGDSGGPLVCKINEKWILVGVASYITDTNYIGALCAVNNVPTSFVRVSFYRNWIQDIIKEYS